MESRLRRGAVVLTLAATCWLGSLHAVFAERPSAPKLLPRETLAYFRIHDVAALKEKFSESVAGKLASDEQIGPLLGQLWQSAGELFGPLEAELGLSLDEMVQIPGGEMCIALVSPNKSNPVLVGLMDVNEKMVDAQKLLDRAERAMKEDGATRSTQQHGDTELVVHRFRGDSSRHVVYFEREGLLAFATDLDVATGLLDTWNGIAESEAATLADNRKFTGIMRKSAGTKDERPQLTWFVDPLELAKRAGRGNLGFQTVLALLEPLGLDGLEAVGGSVIFGTEEFDSIVHVHLLLSNPRKRVLDVLAMTSGDTTPEAWVPRDVASYMTMHWDARQSYEAVSEVYDLIRGEDAWGTMIQSNVSDRLNLDFQKDLIDQLDGRITMVTWMQKPAKLNSQSRLIGAKLNDPVRFRATLKDLTKQFETFWEEKTFSGQTYYEFSRPNRRRRQQQGQGDDRERITRRTELIVGLIGDYAIFADSEKLFQQAVTAKGDPSNSLARELDYKLIASKIKRHAGSQKPGLVYFDRPEEGMRLLYDLMTGDATRDRLDQASDSNQVFGALNKALKDNPLPPFHKIAQYLAPRGGMMTNDETGFHYTIFTMRRE